MADELSLNLWFPTFGTEEMLARALCVLRQFPFSQQRPGVTAIAIHPLSWSEAPVLAQSFVEQADVEHAILLASEFLHDDYGYEFQALWDLWSAGESADAEWALHPSAVRFVVNGEAFDEGAYQQDGHIQVEFGPDAPFLFEDETLTPEASRRVRANVHKLVSFTTAIEKSCGLRGRVLASESEE